MDMTLNKYKFLTSTRSDKKYRPPTIDFKNIYIRDDID